MCAARLRARSAREVDSLCGKRIYSSDYSVNEKDTSGSIKKKISESKDRCDIKTLYKITLTGVRDEDVIPDTAHMDDIGNVLEIVDETRPAFDSGASCCGRTATISSDILLRSSEDARKAVWSIRRSVRDLRLS